MALAVRIAFCIAFAVPVLSTSVPTHLSAILRSDGEIRPHVHMPDKRQSTLLRVEDADHKLGDEHQKDNICSELSHAEDSVDQLDDLSDGKVDGYLQGLAQWRHIFLGRGLAQPVCRQLHVGDALCRAGSRLLARTNSSSNHTASDWEKHSQDLLSFEKQFANCSNVPDHFGFEKWQQWVPEAFGNAPSDMSTLLSDGEYDRVYSAGGHRAPAYGPEGAPSVPVVGKGQIHKERAEHLMLFHMLRKAAEGMELRNISQVLQFGGGTGDLPAMFFDMGLDGTHLVYDTEPMLLMQLYWLRMGGVPAFLGETLAPSAKAVHKRIVLESMDSEKQMLKSHLDLNATTAAQSLFWGVGSFMRAPEELRNKLRPMLQTFGLIYVVYCHEGPECQNNTDYIRKWAEEDLNNTHNVLAWAADRTNAYFLALQKVRGNLSCLVELNCTNNTLLPVGPQQRDPHDHDANTSLFSSVMNMLSTARLPTWRTDGFCVALILAGAAGVGVCVLAATPKKDGKFISGQAHLMERLPFLRRLASKRALAGDNRQTIQTRSSGLGGLA